MWRFKCSFKRNFSANEQEQTIQYWVALGFKCSFDNIQMSGQAPRQAILLKSVSLQEVWAGEREGTQNNPKKNDALVWEQKAVNEFSKQLSRW